MCHSVRRVQVGGQPPVTKKIQFLAGLFLVCMCVLMLQIVETRILSVISYYHLAFFAVSMAMFGMTAGSLIVYLNQRYFTGDRLFSQLCWIASAFAASVAISAPMLSSTVLFDPTEGLVLSTVQMLQMVILLVPAYVFDGMAISLALTRSSWPVAQVYSADLAGAAFGCLGVLILLSLLDGVSAMLAIGALGAAAACVF